MKKTIIIPLLLLLGACNSGNTEQPAEQEPNKLQQLSWLAGDWHMSANSGNVIEHWEVVNDTLMQGAAYFIIPKGDTPEREVVRLMLTNDMLYYMPTASNQNDDKAVSFKEHSFRADDVSFENPEHDYPKFIRYKKLSDSSIYASISLGENDTVKRVEFNYTRRR